MKKILFLILLIPLLSFGQRNAILIKINVHERHLMEFDISLYNASNHNEIISYSPDLAPYQNNEYDTNFKYIIIPDNSNDLILDYNCEIANSIGVYDSFTINYDSNTHSYNYTRYFTELYDNSDYYIEIYVYPIHIVNSNQTVCNTDNIFLLNGYHWQYSILDNPDRNNPNDWTNLTNYDGQQQISVSLPNLLGNNHPNFIYFRSGFRGVTNSDNSNSGSGWTNIVQYTLQTPPPILYDDPNTSVIDGIEVIQPDCSGNNTKINFTVDRILYTGETFDCELSNYNNQFIPCTINNPANPTTTIIDGNTYYIYTCEATVIDTGNYTFKYSTVTNNIASCSGGEYNLFINVPTQVNFTATKIQDVSCYGGNDGQIEITANGGTGKYQYSTDNGSTWYDFDNINSTPDDFNSLVTQTIDDNLEADAYRIKVRDVNLTDNSIHCTGYVRDTSVNPQVITNEDYIDITIDQPADFSATITGYDFTCPENPSTTIEITEVSGGTPTYKYRYKLASDPHWLPSDTTWYDITNTSSTEINIFVTGSYNIQVTDDKECKIIESNITINKPDEISLNYNVTNPTCYDAADGVISGTISGGTLAQGDVYNVTYGINQSVPVDTIGYFEINNLTNGDYAITIKDSNNCSKSFNIPLNEPKAGFSAQVIENVLCYGDRTGQIEISATGTPGNYQYSYDNGNNWHDFTNPINQLGSNSTTETISGLTANLYHIRVRKVIDEHNGDYCNAFVMQNNQPSNLTVLQIEITQPDEPITFSNIQWFNPSVNGNNDGKIIIDVSGGTQHNTAPFYKNAYLIKTADNSHIQPDNNPVMNNNVVTYTFSSLSSGSYLLYVQDWYDCDKTSSSSIDLEDPAVLEITEFEISQSINCIGDQGELEFSFTGGVAPYIVQWQKLDINNNTWNTFDTQSLPQGTTSTTHQVSAGTYRVILQDHGADPNSPFSTVISNPLNISDPPQVTFEVTKHDISCPDGNDGYITIEATGGSGEYQYNTNDGTGWHEFTNNPTTPNPSNTVTEQISLVAGVYTIEVKDLNNCEGINTNNNTQIEITEPNPIVFDVISQQDPTAHNIDDGQIVISVTGGTTDTAQYQYGYQNVTLYDQNGASYSPSGADLTGNPVQFTFSQLPGGYYYLHIEDANDCLSDSYNTNNINNYIHLTQPGLLSVNIELVTPIDCHGNNTGAIKAIGNGGVVLNPNDNNGLPYHYNWQKQVAGTWQDLGIDDMIISDLEAATYKVIITDANGITAEAQYLLTEPDEIILNMSATQISCNPGGDGTATVNITGGTPPYQIVWRNTTQTIIGTTQTIENLIAGTYTVTVTDAHSCSATADITLQQPGGMQVSIIQQNDPTCYGYNDGSIEVSVSGGQPPYTYIWAVNTTHNSPLLENLTAGTYDLTIIDNNNCRAMMRITLNNPPAVIVDLGPDQTLCVGQEAYFDISISDPNAIYEWTGDNGFTSNSPQVSITESGTYTATVTTSAGCSNTDQITINTSTEEIDADFLVTSQAFAGEDVILINTSTPIGSSVEWEVPNNVQIVQQNNETITLHFDNPGLYDITLISHQGYCIAYQTKTILVNEARDLPEVNSETDKFIQNFNIYPNPSNGTFTVEISLAQAADISLRLFSLTAAAPINDQIKTGLSDYQINYQLTTPPGTYFLLLETNGKREIRKVIIQ